MAEGKTYLVTGGCGFIGGHLSRTLAAQGHRVRILDDLSTGHRENAPADAEIVIGCVTDAELVAECVYDVAGVFHLAAIASVERCNSDWARAHHVNAGGTVTVMEQICKAQPVPAPLVWASSAAIYGATESQPIRETARPDPLSPYGADKLAGELHGKAAAELFGLDNTALRFFNVFGPGQDPSSPYSGVISIFADRLAHGDGITIFGDGRQTRDFIYVGDVVSALTRSMQRLRRRRDIHLPAAFDAINVCTGVETTVETLARSLYALTAHADAAIGYAAPRDGDIRHSLGDPSKMIRLLDFRAETTLDDGLRALLAFTREPLAVAS